MTIDHTLVLPHWTTLALAAGAVTVGVGAGRLVLCVVSGACRTLAERMTGKPLQ